MFNSANDTTVQFLDTPQRTKRFSWSTGVSTKKNIRDRNISDAGSALAKKQVLSARNRMIILTCIHEDEDENLRNA